MKKTLVIVAAMIAPVMAQAGINISVRSDYINTMKYKNDADADVSGSSLFVPSYARLNGTGKVGDADVKASFNLRPPTGVPGNMTWDQFTDYLYIAKSHGDWSFTAGKIESALGGFESTTINNGDAYLRSVANGGTSPLGYTPVGSSAVVSVGNTSGFGVAWGTDHKVELQVMNEQNPAADNKRHTYGVNYNGSFGDWKAKAAYYSGATDAVGAESNQKYINAGVSGNVAGFGITFDYLNNTSETKPTTVKSETTSMVGLFSYDMGMYKPQLKVESSTNKEGAVGNAGDFDRMGLAAALEIKPSDDDFRYHVAYVMADDKLKVAGLANDKVKWSQLIVGIKYTGDLLK